MAPPLDRQVWRRDGVLRWSVLGSDADVGARKEQPETLEL